MDTGDVDYIRYKELAELIARRRPACGTTTVVAIDGLSGSGKTSLADGIASISGASVLHLDDVYPGWTGLAATPLIIRDLLEQLAIGAVGRIQLWDWAIGQWGATRNIPPVDLLILEGAASGAAILRPYLSFLIWVDAPLHVRKSRALARDSGAYEPFWDAWAIQEAEHFAAEQTSLHADLAIDTGG